MAPSSQTRTIRFNETDLRDIDRFLKQNPIFDFSTLARVAIRQFIENPSVAVRGLGATENISKKAAKRSKEVEL